MSALTGNRKLTPDDVRLICALRAEGLTLREIGEKFEVSHRVVHACATRETYRNVE